MIKLLIFDLDDTLYSEIEYLRYVFVEYGSERGINQETIEGYLEAFSRSRINKTDLLSDFLISIDTLSKKNHRKLFQIYSNINCYIEIYPFFKKVFKIAKESNIHLAILTNGVVSVQKNKVRCLGILDHVDEVFFARESSGKDGEKPNLEAFWGVLNKYNLNPSNACMVGDSLVNDYNPALSIGMNAILIDNNYFKANANYRNEILEDLRKYMRV